MVSLLPTLRNAVQELSAAEAKLAARILENPEAALNASVDTLAARAEVSTATVVRFCRSLGFEGLRDFRVALAVELKDRSSPPLSVTAGIAQQVLHANIQALQDTVALLDTAAVERAAEALLAASSIAAFASGLSTPIALDAAHRLQRLGLPGSYNQETYNQTVRAAQLGPGQVALCVSHSGRTLLTVECAKLAREVGATTIALTSAPRSTLAQSVDIALITATSEAELNQEAVSSRLAHLAVVDILCATLKDLAPERIQTALERTHQAERQRRKG